MSDDVVVHTATSIWSSVEYGGGMHKGEHLFVTACDYDVVKAKRDELLAALKEARADVARVESGKFCDLRETLRAIDAAMDKAHAVPSSPDL